MHVCQLQYDSFTIQVSASDTSNLQWLGEFLSPSFRETKGETSDWSVTVVSGVPYAQKLSQGSPAYGTSEIDCFTRDSHFLRLPIWEERSDECTVYDEQCQCFYRVARGEQKVEIISKGEKHQVRRALARVLREVVTIHCIKRGDIPVHAAAYMKNGLAYVLAGPRRSGKSTLLTEELIHGDASYIANDRVMLQSVQGKTTVHGMPTVIKLRPNTIAMYPKLSKLQAERSYHREFLLSEVQPKPEDSQKNQSAKVSRAQFCELTGSNAVDTGPLCSLLFPSVSNVSGSSQFKRLRPAEAYELLYNSLLLSDLDYPLSALFCSPDAEAIDPMRLSMNCVNIIRSTNCYQVLVSRHRSDHSLPTRFGLIAA